MEEPKKEDWSNQEEFSLKPEKNSDLETELAQKWLGRIGIVTLIFGIALFLGYSLKYFGPAGKIGIGALVALTLIGIGFYSKKKYQLLGQALFGGGFALLYFTTYASHFIQSASIISNQYVALGLMAIIGLLYLGIELQQKQEGATVLPLVLLFLTANVGSVEYFSLIMLLMFTAVCLVIFSYKSWKLGHAITVFLSLATLTRWLITRLMTQQTITSEVAINALVIIGAVYLGLTTAQFFVYKRDHEEYAAGEDASLISFYSFIIFLLSYLTLTSAYKDASESFFLVFGILNALLALLARFVSNEKTKAHTYIGIATLSIALYVPQITDGLNSVSLWLIIGGAYTLFGSLWGTIRSRLIGSLVVLFCLLATAWFGYFPETSSGYIAILLTIIAVLYIMANLVGKNPDLRANEEQPTLIQGINQDSLYALNAFGAVLALSFGSYFVVDAKYLTLAFGAIGFMVPLIGFPLKDKYLRRFGLLLLLIAVLKLFVFDMSGMEVIFRIISFIILGSLLILMSFGYTKYKDKIKEYI